jgi:hypothetical protein
LNKVCAGKGLEKSRESKNNPWVPYLKYRHEKKK